MRSSERIQDYLRTLGPAAEGVLRVESVTTRPAEIEAVLALPGETPEAARNRYDLEGRLIHAMVWSGMSPDQARDTEEMSIRDFVAAMDRIDFVARYEHHVAARNVLASCRGLDTLVELLESAKEGTRLGAAKALVASGGDHELFRSKIMAAMQHSSRNGADPKGAGVLAEVMQEAARMHGETKALLEQARGESLSPADTSADTEGTASDPDTESP